MPFQFSLMPVLRFRETLARREYLTLEKIQQEITLVQVQLKEVEDGLNSAVKQRLADLAKGVAAIHLEGSFERELTLARQRDAIRTKLDGLKLRHKQHLKIYEVARQKQEVLDDLHKKQLAAYEQEQGRREQAVVDDLFLSRRKRGE
jgi:flagellar export protein FliJ